MRHTFLLLIFSLQILVAHAQRIDLPAKSLHAKTAYTIGYTEIEIDYSAPAVKGRELWGVVVPYDEVWRAGANQATTVSFSTDVEVERNVLKAGKYSFFVIPRESGKWTAVFNRDTSLWGAYEYDEAKDALRVEVSPRFSDKNNEERLKYEIASQNLENGYILLSWGKLRLYVRIKVDAMDKAVEEIKAALSNSTDENRWMIEGSAADFLLWIGQPGPAYPYIERSINQQANSWNYWIKAKIHAALGDKEQALDAAEKVIATAKASDKDNYYTRHQGEIDWMIEQWKKK